MPKPSGPRRRGRDGHVKDVRFVEVEFAAPAGSRMIIELDGGVRLMLADRGAIPLAAGLIEHLRSSGKAGAR